MGGRMGEPLQAQRWLKQFFCSHTKLFANPTSNRKGKGQVKYDMECQGREKTLQSKARWFTAVKIDKGVCFRTSLGGNTGRWEGFRTDHLLPPRPAHP